MTRLTEQLDAMVAELPARRGGRFLFADACGAFWALKRGFPQRLVAKAFGMSEQTMGLLARCEDANSRNYQRVAAEFRRLGETDFAARYYTDDINTRLFRIHMNVPKAGDVRSRGPAMSAAKYAGPRPMLRIDHSPCTLIFEQRPAGDISPSNGEPLPAGWAFREEEYDAWDFSRFPTSSLAYRHALSMGYEEPN